MVKELGKIPLTSGEGGHNTVNTFAVGSGMGWHKPVRSDCLLKTQVRAKSQDEVYGTDACPVLEG